MSDEAKCANCGHGESQHSGGGQWKGMSWCCNPASGERASPWTALCNCLKFIRRDPAAGEEPTTDHVTLRLVELVESAAWEAKSYSDSEHAKSKMTHGEFAQTHRARSADSGRDAEALYDLAKQLPEIMQARRSLQESRSELARLQGLLAEGLGLMRESHDEIAALKQSIIQASRRADDAELKVVVRGKWLADRYLWRSRAEDAERKLARLELEKEALATGRVWCGRDRWWYGAIGPSANGPFDTAQDALDAALADHPEKP